MLVVLALVTSGCLGGDSAELGSGRGAPPTTAPRFFPLTGLMVGDPALATRQAVTVKIENSAASRPQTGLDKADVVYEAVVEGGQTRFLAVFHSTDAPVVGPVRSVRSSDPAIVAPFGGVVAYSGGIARFVNAMKATGLTNFDETSGANAFGRRRDKSAPHNLYVSVPALLAKAPEAGVPPPFAPFLRPGEAFAPAGALPVSSLAVAVGGSSTTGYQYDPSSATWKRSTDGRPFMVENGGQVAPTTVIVQFVSYEPTGEVDTSGSAVLEAKVVGSGDAVVFAGGLMVNARWSKPSPTAMTTYTDLAGAPISLPAGRTWVELPAVGSALTTT